VCWIKFYVIVHLVRICGDKVRVHPFGVTYNQNIIHVTYVECYVSGVKKTFYMFIFEVL